MFDQLASGEPGCSRQYVEQQRRATDDYAAQFDGRHRITLMSSPRGPDSADADAANGEGGGDEGGGGDHGGGSDGEEAEETSVRAGARRRRQTQPTLLLCGKHGKRCVVRDANPRRQARCFTL